MLAMQIMALRLPKPVYEYRFHGARKWRFDLAWPDDMIAAEVEGGIWKQGRHTRGKGYENDMRKYDRAALLGWCVLRFSTGMVDSGEAIKMLQEALA